ncbi:MAG: hypothetical protein RMI49_01215 [Candidatus Caldarchaeum sp.]|nr:hypothetical protein [Candidatus Caldarchaeum sp.]
MKQIIFTIPCVSTSRTIELSLTGKTVEELEDLTEHLKQMPLNGPGGT